MPLSSGPCFEDEWIRLRYSRKELGLFADNPPSFEEAFTVGDWFESNVMGFEFLKQILLSLSLPFVWHFVAGIQFAMHLFY